MSSASSSLSLSPSPSPSLLVAHPEPPLPAWHFPFGPSTRYHTREQPRPQHARNHSAYTPTAPSLSTERRAHHRRAHSQKISLAFSPPHESSRSPLSRFANHSTSNPRSNPAPRTMAAHNSAAAPVTPAKPRRRPSLLPQPSPFSDYYTDEARSDDAQLPDSSTKQLLVRMHRLQSQLMRDQHSSDGEQNDEATRIIGSKLSEIELQLNMLHSQTRTIAEVEDSADLGDGDTVRAKRGSQSVYDPYLQDRPTEFPPEPVTIDEFRAERDWFILRMQELLTGLHTARTELSKRLTEVRELNERHSAELEERETQLERLRSENESLKSQAGFEYSELLFLKLQMKAVEVDVDTLPDTFDIPDATAVMKERHVKKNRILSEMDRWRADWQDVHGRFQLRRGKPSSLPPDRRDSRVPDEEEPSSGDEVQWHLETVKEGRGRVTSVTIRRMDSSYSDDRPEEDAGDTRLADSTLGESLYAPAQTPSPDTATVPVSTTIPPHGPREPPIAYSYTHRATQTDPADRNESNLDGEDDDDNDDDTTLFPDPPHVPGGDTADSDEDCAITTSSELSDLEQPDDDDDDDDDDDAADEILASHASADSPAKTAWRELWSSLASLSGMGDERFEE